jgi:diguanylate cyclase (GGDEF)-like protein
VSNLKQDTDKMNGIVGFIEKHREFFIKKKTRFISVLAGIALYLALYVLIIVTSTTHPTDISILGCQIPFTTLMSTLSQIQLLTVVCILIIHREKGYVINWVLLIMSSVSSLIAYLHHVDNEIIPGILVPLSNLLVVVVIYSYIRFSWNKYKEVLAQQEEIVALYEEISASESTLIEQRNLLLDYNGILEEREEELNQLAFYDALTGLPNRRLVIDRLDALLQICKKDPRKFAVVFVDLDNFKKINDSAGHQVGDEVLQVIARRWKEVLNKNDVLARLGGDEFAIIIQRSLDQDEIEDYVNELRTSLNERVYYRQREFYAKASFGVSRYPEDGDTSELLLKYADMAMYEAKARKQNEICFFNQEMHQQFQRNVLIESHLQQILTRRELSLVYQPQFYGKTRELRGFEALARWNNSKLGVISPMDFIPIAEESGMIIPMGEFILIEACRTCREWMDITHKEFILSVNVSPVQLLDASFVPMVQQVLKLTGFPARHLEVEVTETAFISSMEYTIAVLNELKEMGIKIALDDFGTGYASLSYLQKLPIDFIKIDKTFVDDIVTEKRHCALVKSIVEIAHEFSMQVIAEGVEEEVQLEMLNSIQCDFVQGYLLGRPMEEGIKILQILR